jgi:hypothetical protein
METAVIPYISMKKTNIYITPSVRETMSRLSASSSSSTIASWIAL